MSVKKSLDEYPEYDNLQFDEEYRFPDGNLVLKTVRSVIYCSRSIDIFL